MKTLEMRLRAKLGPTKVCTKEKKLEYDMNYILKKIKTGDLDMTKTHQRIKVDIAIKKGLITKEDIL